MPEQADPTDPIDPTADERAQVRSLFGHLEAVHTLVYFAPRIAEAHAGLGLDRPRSGYTAGRLCAMGPVGPEVATAVLHGFSPTLLASVLPWAWEVASPGQVLRTTTDAVGRTLAPLLTGLDDEVAAAAELGREAALLQPIVGRPLAAARSAVPWPESPQLVLWEAATRLREARGDGHVAALVLAGLDGVEGHLSHAGDGVEVRRATQHRRGWTDAEWEAGIVRLQQRGILDGDAQLTDRGRAVRAEVEARTDAAATAPWRALGPERSGRLLTLLQLLVRPLVASGVLPTKVTDRVASA